MLRNMHKRAGSGAQAGQGSSGRDPAGAGNRSWPRTGRRALRIAGTYAICGFLWIALSDRILAELIQNSIMLTRFQTYKGWGFILITAALVFALSRRALRETERLSLSVRESEARLNTILDNVGAAIFIKDAQYRYTYVNRKTTEILGLRTEEILGKGDEAFFSRASVAEIMRSDRMVIEKGETVAREEADLVASLGMPRTYWTVKLPLRNADGAVTGLCGISTDITERERAEEALRASEEKFKALVETSYDWIWEVNERGVYTYASPRVQNILGYSTGEVVGRTPFDFMPPEEKERVAVRFRETVRKREPLVGMENINLRKDGSRAILETSGMPVFDATGAFRGYRGIDRDITERKRAEDALRESEEQYRRLVQAANSVILTWDITGTILFINDFGERFFGYRRDELVGRNVVGTIVPERETSGRDLAQLMQEIQKAPDRYMDNENENITKDGARVWIRWANKAVMDPRGSLVGILSVGNDITRRKRAEEALQENRRFLEAVIDAAPT